MPEIALGLLHAAARRPDADRDVDDVTLVRAVRAGEPRAFERLHRHYAPFVHGILVARVPIGDADDLVQDVFVLAVRKLGTLRDADALGPWLARIARNAAARFHRRRRRHAPLPDELADNREEDSGDTHEAHAVLRKIMTLPAAYHETLVLRLVEGLNGPQIAQATGMTPGSVRVNLHRGMKLLRERLEECP